MKFTASTILSALLISSSHPSADAFVGVAPRTAPSASATSSSAIPAALLAADLTFEQPDTKAVIEEDACNDAAAKMQRVLVPVSTDIAESGNVGISYIHFEAPKGKAKKPPVVLIHGFDSSCLEYRRLGPRLSQDQDVYFVDILGWGYTQLEGVSSFSADSKLAALQSFLDTKFANQSIVLGGASLGGAVAIEAGAGQCESCSIVGMILIDAQGFVDGVGPMASLPGPLAKAGVQVLKSIPLRNMANQMSYYDKETYATEEAQVIGRLHCLRDGWSDAMVSFMKSGGFQPSEKVAKIDVPTLILWGRQDGILEGDEYAQQFLDTMPDAQLEWIEECGHVPHLEQPEATAATISKFMTERIVANNKAASASATANGG